LALRRTSYEAVRNNVEAQQQTLDMLMQWEYMHTRGSANEAVRQSLIDHINTTEYEFIGTHLLWAHGDIHVYISPTHAIAQVDGWGTFIYQHKTNEYGTHWQLLGYDIIFGFHPVPPPRVRRHITNDGYVDVHIFYNEWCMEEFCNEDCDCEFGLLHFHKTETVRGEYLWEEFIRLMQLHRGTYVWDFWFYDTKLYLDIVPGQWWGYTMGTASTAFGLFPILDSLTHTFPWVTEIELLFGGMSGWVYDHHGAFYGVYTVGAGFMDTEMWQWEQEWLTQQDQEAGE